ncbi:site-specific integrase [Rhodanobacter glycinis]|uniref:Site-specific integrase n=1 Tax=Rhodanobacter glycinis TaxID=582702 RepID=A0A5B9E2A2_9GAMM|nr:site-specific integrase [Rhodanobacter glycinis]QEE24396.1 site-specific integrase [Rhodanobacter glycinis]
MPDFTALSPLYAYVLQMPNVTVVQVTIVDQGRSLPALVVVDENSGASFHRELLASARKFRFSGWGLEHINRYVRTIGRFIEFYVALGLPVLDEAGLQRLVWEYLDARFYGTLNSEDMRKRELYWKPCRWNTVRHDCRAISDFSDFCSRSYGYLPLVESSRVQHLERGSSYAALQGLKTAAERTVLGHLRLLRKPKANAAMPGRKQMVTSGMGRAVMSVQQAWDVIDAEKNPTYRMIWLLGFWGGPRICEQLNMWRCDVLPGDVRRLLFNKDPFRDTPLVVLANPWESTYCGDLGRETISRRVLLAEKFEMHPRPDLRVLDGGVRKSLWAGWKGMLETNEARHISQVFWADHEAAREYGALFESVIDHQFDLGIHRQHPYLLVNLDPRHADWVGSPLKLSNVSKAWNRAVSRVGLVPHRFGVSIHGMRHFYKSYVEELGLSRKVIQIMMRHRSLSSQDLYGGLSDRIVRELLAVSSRRRRNKIEGR